jgi:hypothetical protein
MTIPSAVQAGASAGQPPGPGKTSAASGIHLQVIPLEQGLNPDNVGPGSCSDPSAIGFLTGNDVGEPEWYCYSGHGVLNQTVADVNRYVASYETWGKFSYSRGAVGTSCTIAEHFSPQQSNSYDPPITVCQIDLY